MWKRVLLCMLCLSFTSPFLMAQDSPSNNNNGVRNDYQYFQLEPDIITNYIKEGSRIGFVRITVELMVKSKTDYDMIEKHMPLIRDKIITIFGRQSEVAIKSVADREGIRQHCLDAVNEVLFQEMGRRPVIELLFTKYLYQ